MTLYIAWLFRYSPGVMPERTLWRMADSIGKVAAEAGGKTVRAGVPAVRTDIAGLPRKARKKPLTLTMGGDSVRFLQLTDNIS